MPDFRNLRVYHDALAQLHGIAGASSDVRFGDLTQQIRRAAISVVSNIAEGAGRGSDADFARLLCIARASNDEVAAQLDIIVALGDRTLGPLQSANQAVGRQLSALIRTLRDGAKDVQVSPPTS